jgi:hypothetical protein
MERDDRIVDVVLAKLGVGHDDVVVGVATNAWLAIARAAASLLVVLGLSFLTSARS